MHKKILITTHLLLIILMSVSAQTQLLQSKARVIECKAPYQKIKVDLLDDEGNFIKEFPITSDTKITNKKGDPEKAENLKPGNEILIESSKQGYKTVLISIVITSTKTGSKVDVNGKLESYVVAKNYAVIDGRKVKLNENVKIVGKNQLKNQVFKSFSEITPGYFIKADGEHRPDGIVYLSSAFLTPDNYTDTDRKLRSSMNADFSSSLMKKTATTGDSKQLIDTLISGKLKFGDMEYAIVDNLKLQAYVNNVGNKIVPFYQKEIPSDVAEKLNFQFVVVDNPIPNIFTMPNGLVIINSGLMQLLDNEAQLAALLGHEIAHCTHKHAAARFEQQEKQKNREEAANDSKELLGPLFKNLTSNNALISTATRDFAKAQELIAKLPPQTQAAVGNIITSVKGVVDNNFNKENEEQADRVGLNYMQEAGYNPLEGVAIWEKFMNLSNDVNKMAELKALANSWMVAKDRFSYTNPLVSVGDVISAKIVNVLLDNNFSDHPKAKTRFRNVNQLVAENYCDMDFSTAIINEVQYKEIKLLLPAVPIKK